jgi:hypothetical protein
MKIQTTHSRQDRGLDAYFTPEEATIALINIEKQYIPSNIWEPACGNGAISKVLLKYGYSVISSDIDDYGYQQGKSGIDYLCAKCADDIQAIVTNPPYCLAQIFVEKAVTEVAYVALLLRTNFLESASRLSLFRKHPPIRVWISSRRLPMMHRYNWQGPQAPSNTCHAWFIWQSGFSGKTVVDWFDWKEFHSRDFL